jgi:cell wall-associated NlpC family hydrolase
MMLGIAAPRDTDMQQRTLGQSVADHNNFQALESGDLIFWPGHVGIMMDADRMIHANGHSMSVIIEPVRGAIDRIAYMYQQPSDVRRLGWR